MSRSDFEVRQDYTGTGTLDTYTFDFKIERAKDLLIKRYDGDGALLNTVRGTEIGAFLTDLTFDEVKGGGEIELAANLPSGHKLILLLANDEPVQTFQFKSNFDLSLPRVEKAFDFVVGPIQRLVYRIGRVWSLSDNFDVSTFDMEIPNPQPGKVLAVNADGDGLEWVDPLTIEWDQPGIPAGGDTGDALVKQSNVDFDAEWKSYGVTGYSSRFNQAIATDTLEETLAWIIAISYQGPQVSLAASGSGTIREKGAAVTAVTLTATITKRSDPIAEVRFYKGATLIHTESSPNPAGGTETYNWMGSFDDNESFSVQVDDDGSTGGPTTASSTQNFTFVYPYYVGASTAAETAANVALMTKRLISSTTSRTETITAASGEVFYFAYPASYGALVSILDVNNFETFPDWTLRTENITGLDGNPVSYRIYEFNNPVTAGSYQFTFKRS